RRRQVPPCPPSAVESMDRMCAGSASARQRGRSGRFLGRSLAARDVRGMARPSETPPGSRLTRLREIAAVMARHGFAPTMRSIPLLRPLLKAFGVRDVDAEAVKKPAAERFASMLEDLGPTFVKLGQILSTRGDLVPADFVIALARLQDQVPPFPFADVKTQIETALGKPVADLFASID